MADKQIWAPWRIGYVSGEGPSGEADEESSDLGPGMESGTSASTYPGKGEEPDRWHTDADRTCFLCRGAAHYTNPRDACRDNLVLWQREHVFAVLNRYPYTNGHLLVAPLRHVAELSELTDQEHLQAMQTLGSYTHKIRQLLKADGFNIGLNLGATAGAGVPGHLHWHLVPRWEGDHNFMPTLAGARVIPQSLAAVWEVLVEV